MGPFMMMLFFGLRYLGIRGLFSISDLCRHCFRDFDSMFQDQRRVFEEIWQGCRSGSTGAGWPALTAQLKKVEIQDMKAA